MRLDNLLVSKLWALQIYKLYHDNLKTEVQITK